MPTTRRRFLSWAAAAGIVAIAGDSILLEPNCPRIVRQDFFLPRWPERLNGFTVALLSDFHYDPYFSAHPLHAAIAMVNGLRPDLIVLTGDFVSVPLLGSRRKAALAGDPPNKFRQHLGARRRAMCSPFAADDRALRPLGRHGKPRCRYQPQIRYTCTPG